MNINSRFIDFILTNLMLYFFAMGVWSLWSYFAFVGLEKMDWQGSIVYLPHGIRVLGICFFGLKSLPALMAAELTGPLFINPEQYMIRNLHHQFFVYNHQSLNQKQQNIKM